MLVVVLPVLLLVVLVVVLVVILVAVLLLMLLLLVPPILPLLMKFIDRDKLRPLDYAAIYKYAVVYARVICANIPARQKIIHPGMRRTI